jgi:hypothetical protein
MPSILDVLMAEEVLGINLQAGGVLYGTYDPEDETGPHTGWFYGGPANPNTGYFFLGSAASESEAHDAAEALFSAAYKRVTSWKCSNSGPFSSTCYMV